MQLPESGFYGSLSLDLDNQWSYMKTAGYEGWQALPSYLDTVVPQILDLLAQAGLTITVFLVGQDAASTRNREVLAAISAAGHEIGNHSFHHEPWLHLYDWQALQTELSRAEEHIERATGRRPLGFRSPGFDLCHPMLQLLAQRGYLYDASVLPTFTGPLARAYFFRKTQLNQEEKHTRKDLFGKFKNGFSPLNPFVWDTAAGNLFEIPITTMPVLRTPTHVSYLLYLSGFSTPLALGYFRSAIRLWLWSGVHPSLLLHPLDFLNEDDVPELSSFPGMKIARAAKINLLREILQLFTEQFRVITLEEQARMLAQRSDLPKKALNIGAERSAGNM